MSVNEATTTPAAKTYGQAKYDQGYQAALAKVMTVMETALATQAEVTPEVLVTWLIDMAKDKGAHA